jgi:hypothetical protein
LALPRNSRQLSSWVNAVGQRSLSKISSLTRTGRRPTRSPLRSDPAAHAPRHCCDATYVPFGLRSGKSCARRSSPSRGRSTALVRGSTPNLLFGA